MNMFARFDENPAMTLQDIKETKRYGRTDGRTHAHTDARTHTRTDNVKTVYPPQTKFAGGITKTMADVGHQRFTKFVYYTPPLIAKSSENFHYQLF